ncbi:hypothetical protein J6590_015422 [Homalodisca vitripennis]|nr:hypothetical protein J6590_015422 [Homalodisca vitripennis]
MTKLTLDESEKAKKEGDIPQRRGKGRCGKIRQGVPGACPVQSAEVTSLTTLCGRSYNQLTDYYTYANGRLTQTPLNSPLSSDLVLVSGVLPVIVTGAPTLPVLSSRSLRSSIIDGNNHHSSHLALTPHYITETHPRSHTSGPAIQE